MRLPIMLVCLGLACPAGAEDVSFATPSGNIQCRIGTQNDIEALTCSIHERSGPLPRPRPPGCTFDWGHVFAMQREGEAVLLCAEVEEPAPPETLVEFGITSEFDGFTCQSTAAGLDCRNLDGHGFFLSRSSQVLY
ncbi:DUF6636 domain-containing protein [Pseudooceanicola sp. LIPI14-2-Ac024]|uniref:DUF6636 domain-containing protein n=1 Tax=Pseudooceanicola sp. LIPI14-2-Ac024 TaxID=3344875 RepID=UPI0035CF0EA9